VRSDAGRSASAPAVASVEVKPGADGAFLASLPISEAPIESYAVQVLVESRVVVARWVDVTIIRKPPYQLALSPDHRAVIVGTKVAWTTTATFFDGTPVASLGLAVSSDQFDDERTLTTDAAGKAVITVAARPADQSETPWEDPDSLNLSGRPQGPESAEIWADGSIVVFPSAVDLQASGVVAGGRLRVTGSLAAVDLAKVERAIARGTWEGDAAGAPLGGRPIQVRITELIPVREQAGFDYDFIAKEVRPVYEYHIERKALRTLTVRSAADGTIAVSSAVPNAAHDYEVVLSTTDAAGRIQGRTITAGTAVAAFWATSGIVFRTTDGKVAGEEPYGVGDRIVWRMVDDGKALPSGGAERYLYLVAQRGLRSAVVTDSSTFRRVLAEADAPGVFVIGVQFNGSTYAPKAAAWANFDVADRAIRVAVSADQARYEPGGAATLSVRTTRPDGSPVPATVVIQAVDEKLYAMGGATVPTPLNDLYQRVDSGILRLTATHQVPTRSGPEGEGGDATGGEPRSDFKDTLLFRELRTDSTGRASTTVKLSDDLTAWHVTASAVTADLEAGVGERLLRVGLPFFVEVTTADTYLAADRPEIRLRAFGDSLRAGDAVDFTVASASLGVASATFHGTAFTPSRVALPALVAGRQSVTVSATAPGRTDGSGAPLSDALTRTFEVVTSRLTATETSSRTVADGLPAVPAGADRSTWTFADAGRGRVVPILAAVAEPEGFRLDRAIAQSLARSILVATFGRDPATLPPDAFQKGRYVIESVRDDEGVVTSAGVPLVPHGGADPWLAARVALLTPEAFDADALHDVLATIRDAPTTKRDLQIAAIAGLGALGDP
ncbi:MAG TPA: alpha-2-macroglobulin family protein, partial [Candidatus Deferrimicrobium sp.]|nr:alpha-2-macroglobulin family protein [Candidatus Deferrimicrobium sp.]